MKTTITTQTHDLGLVAALNRQMLADNNVFSVCVSGTPGCGKTSLVEAAIKQLAPSIHVGVIACDIGTHLDADRITRRSEQVVQINTGAQPVPDAIQIHEALAALDLKTIDLLLVENIGSLVCGCTLDLGLEANVIVFSVAAGHDKAQKHPELAQQCHVIVLNKIDLLYAVPFDLAAFRGDVRALNPTAELFELSALSGHGVDRWVDWLRQHVRKQEPKTSHWFG
jgi:hydrogenase nickel incorporation protein HypB